MNEKRNFLAANLTESMLSAIRTGEGISKFESCIDELRRLRGNFYSSINNQALNGTLKKLGVSGKRVEKFMLQKGDSVYIIRVEGLEKPMREYGNKNILPETCTLIITKYVAD